MHMYMHPHFSNSRAEPGMFLYWSSYSLLSHFSSSAFSTSCSIWKLSRVHMEWITLTWLTFCVSFVGRIDACVETLASQPPHHPDLLNWNPSNKTGKNRDYGQTGVSSNILYTGWKTIARFVFYTFVLFAWIGGMGGCPFFILCPTVITSAVWFEVTLVSELVSQFLPFGAVSLPFCPPTTPLF